MRIRNISLEEDARGQVLSADLDGFIVWHRFPRDLAISVRGDAFLAAALLPAMVTGEPIEVDSSAEVCPRLLEGIAEIQDVFSTWNPRFKRVAIQASVSPAVPRNEGVASFFSGGVDGSYTFQKHREEITHLVFVQGIDMQVDNDELFGETLAANQRFADGFGKVLVPVTSNIRRFCHPRGTGWSIYNGAGLASFALALAFPKTYIAASYTYKDLFPWGSHPLTDRLWSTAATTLVHDGAEASRSDKLRLLAGTPEALEILRVCWQDAGYNCGKCEKCLRTRIALRLLGLECPTLPNLSSLDELRGLTIWGDHDLAFFQDNLRLARKVGDIVIARALARRVRRYDFRKTVKDIDVAFLGGRLGRLQRRLRGSNRDPHSAKS